MELLYRQLEKQPPGANCWGSRHATADEAQLVVMASAIAGRAEDLYCTGHMGPKDRGARCVPKAAVEASELPPLRVVFWQRVIEMIGHLADHAENVGDRLRLLIAR